MKADVKSLLIEGNYDSDFHFSVSSRLLRFASAAILVILSVSICNSATFTAANNGSWNAPGTWSVVGVDADGIPDADDDVTIPSPRSVTVPGATLNVRNLTINVGGTLNFNTANGTLNIRNNGTVTINGQITDNAANTELNFLDNSGTHSFINNGTFGIDFFEFEGSNASVTVSGTGNFTVTRINFNNTGVTLTVNHTGAFTSVQTLTVGQDNTSILGSGLIDLSDDLNVSANNLIVGCDLDIADDLTALVNAVELTINTGASINVADDLRVGPQLTTVDNFTLTVQVGGTLNLTDDILVNEDNAGQADNFTISNAGTILVSGATTFTGAGANTANNFSLTNSGTITFTGDIDFNNFDDHVITNTGSLNFIGDVNNLDTGGNATTITNTSGTLTISGDIDDDALLNFSAVGNIVNYNGNGGIEIEDPVNNDYYHLIVSVNSDRNLDDNIDVLGNLTVQNTAILDLNGFDLVLSGDLSVANTAILDADPAGSDITIAGDWSITSTAGDPFLQGTRTVTFNGTSNQTISGTALGTTFYNFTVNNTSATPSMTLDDNVIVGGTLSLTDGVINLNSNDLQLGTGTTAGTVGTLNTTVGGWMYGGTHTRYFLAATITPSLANFAGAFVMGNATDIRPIYIYPTVAPTAGTIRVAYNDNDVTTALSPTVNDAGTPITLRHESSWVVSNVTTTGGTYAMYAGGSGFTVGDVNDLRIMRLNSVTGNAGTNVDASPVFLAQRTNISQANLANSYYLGSINAVQTPLPIELLYFKANVENEYVKTEWSTAQETDNHFFTLEKTVDFETFHEVGIIDSKGNSQEKRAYSLIDESPISGKSYYRLKQTDFDGKFTYSEPVMINYEGVSNASLQAYPNPSNGYNITVELKGLREKADVPVVIYDQRGQKVYETVLSKEGRATVTKDINFDSALPQGIYIIKAGKTLELTRKIVVD